MLVLVAAKWETGVVDGSGGSHAESWSAFCGGTGGRGLRVSASGERGSWNNWHVHDGGSGTDANGLRHAGLAFFPQIFGPSYATTPSLWAYCTDATDKALVGGEGGAKEAAGHCQNESSIIHLQVIASDAQAPGGNWMALTLKWGLHGLLLPTPR